MRLAVGRLCKLCAEILAAAVLVSVGAAAQTSPWPSHSILVVSPFASGTTYDTIAKLVLDPVGGQIGQPFLLKDQPGGEGTVGIASVIKASPDGYTLLLVSSAMSTAAILHKSLPYDMLHDLQPVAMFGGEPSMLMAAPGRGYASLANLVTAAKTSPGLIKFASVGIGSASYFAGKQFALAANLDVRHVPYAAAAGALAALAAGQVDFYFMPVTPALPLITEGRGVPLAVSTPNRLQSLAGLPTLAESGYAIPEYLTWCGLSAPINTPREIVNKLNSAIATAMALPSVRSKLLRTGYLPIVMSPEQVGTFLTDEVTSMIKFRKDAHMDPVD
jgi:tripartite-type tricarboxylate transporter receptor subunit TctC